METQKDPSELNEVMPHRPQCYSCTEAQLLETFPMRQSRIDPKGAGTTSSSNFESNHATNRTARLLDQAPVERSKPRGNGCPHPPCVQRDGPTGVVRTPPTWQTSDCLPDTEKWTASSSMNGTTARSRTGLSRNAYSSSRTTSPRAAPAGGSLVWWSAKGPVLPRFTTYFR